jgi:1-acyl-sn-glycerol-3-phosphate acyltransferase
MIKARHHWFYYPFFTWYSKWMPRKDFKRVVLHHRMEDKGLPVLMIGNHVSWWDGFLAHYINLQFFKRKPHVMMLEEQLKARMFLNKTGAYSIKKGSRSALESLRYSAAILTDPKNMVIMYPQGKIHSIYDHPLQFEKGWYRIFKYLEHPIQLVFYVAMFDFYASRKPELHIYLQDYAYEETSFSRMEADFNLFHESSIHQQKERV